MKKFKKSALFLFATVLLFTSCRVPPTIDPIYSDAENNLLPTAFSYNNTSDDRPANALHHTNSRFIYTDGFIYYIDGSTVRYNIETNNRTYVCSDPLCTHDDESDCPLTYRCEYYNGKWYMIRKKEAEDKSLYYVFVCYDPDQGSETEFYTVSDPGDMDGAMKGPERLVIYDGYVFFYEVYYKEEEDEKKGTYTFVYRCLSLETGKCDIMTTLTNAGFQDIFMIAGNGKIYQWAIGEGIYYMLYDGSDRYEKHFIYRSDNTELLGGACRLDGETLYIVETEVSFDPYSHISYLTRIEPDGTITRISVINDGVAFSNYFFTENYLYYTAREKEKHIGYVAGNGRHEGQELMINDYKIYRMDLSGKAEKVFDGFPDEDPYRTCELRGYDIIVVGNYLYTDYCHYGPILKDVYTNDDWSGTLSGLIRIDVTTGEFIYVSGKQKNA